MIFFFVFILDLTDGFLRVFYFQLITLSCNLVEFQMISSQWITDIHCVQCKPLLSLLVVLIANWPVNSRNI